MTNYTREQIKAALRDVDEATATCGGEHVGDPEDHRVDALAGALGLTVEPGPGVYLNPSGDLIVFDKDGDGWNFTSGFRPMATDATEQPALTPARVIPEPEYQQLVMEADMSTEVPVLSEEQARDVFNASQKEAGFMATWGSYTDEARSLYRQIMNAALAKHGRGSTPMPDWDDVREAVASNRGNGWGLEGEAINAITDSVAALLKENNR